MLFWGEAEARVAFMQPSGIRCDCVAEREGSCHFQSLEEKSSGLFVCIIVLDDRAGMLKFQMPYILHA
jgi:hypothetical protein